MRFGKQQTYTHVPGSTANGSHAKSLPPFHHGKADSAIDMKNPPIGGMKDIPRLLANTAMKRQAQFPTMNTMPTTQRKKKVIYRKYVIMNLVSKGGNGSFGQD